MKKHVKTLILLVLFLMILALFVGCGNNTVASETGERGAPGEDGVDGKNGLSAYDLAVSKGYTGTLEEWLEALVGADGNDGLSAYDLAVSKGYTGTLEEWLESLVGADGKDGASAYDLAVSKGYTGTLGDWLASLIGKDGTDGTDGTDGKSAYELAVLKGYTGTEDEWLASLVGDDGADGASAYDLAVSNGYKGTLKEWLASLKGSKGNKGDKGDTGETGENGKSAFELYRDLFGYEGTELEWLNDLINGKLVKYTITFDTDGGTEIAKQIYSQGDIPVKPNDPKKEGYYFRGWYLDNQYTQPYLFNTKLTESITLYAYFSDSIAISDAEGLKAMASNPSAKYYLANDINLGGLAWTSIPSFGGQLDGEGHKIHNFTVGVSSQNSGFFGCNKGTIKNVTFSDFSFLVTASNVEMSVGAVVGVNDGLIDNVHVTDAQISISCGRSSSTDGFSCEAYLGSVVGRNNKSINHSSVSATVILDTSIYNSHSASLEISARHIEGNYYFGGYVGQNNGNIKNVITNIDLTATVKADAVSGSKSGSTLITWIGGLVGYNCSNCTISQSEANVNLTAAANGGQVTELRMAGFVAWNWGTITESCSLGTLRTDANTAFFCAYCAGFVTENRSSITNCYSSVDIQNPRATSSTPYSATGAFACVSNGTFSNCYADGDFSSVVNQGVAGFIGYNLGTVSKSFCGGNISATQSGRFVFTSSGSGSIFKCYYSTSATVRPNPSSSQGEAKTSAELMSEGFIYDTLAWSRDVWVLRDGAYPELSWRITN